MSDRPNVTRRNITLLYDGSYEGLMSAIFVSYAHRPAPRTVLPEDGLQQELAMDYIRVATDPDQYRRVTEGVRGRMGHAGYEMVWRAFLYNGEEKSGIIYRYVRLGMRTGQKVSGMYNHPAVLEMNKICSLVGREAMLSNEFLRFSKLAGGIFYAEAEPEHYVLPLMMPFFVDRLSSQPFIIHDIGRRTAGLYDGRRWYISSTEDMRLPGFDREEQTYRRMWKLFYDTIAIKERLNPVCRRNHMPKKYWKHMTEMHPDYILDRPLAGGEGVGRLGSAGKKLQK